jgi:hypothetical protein
MGRSGERDEDVSLDFQTGVETGCVDLGRDAAVLDQGVNPAVADDGSIVYAGRLETIRVG